MPQKVTVGGRLAEERARLGLTQEALAELVGDGGPREKLRSIKRYENDQRTPGVDFVAKVADAGADAQYIVTGRRSSHSVTELPGFVMVPRYDISASAGHGREVSSEQVVDYLAFKADWVRNALGVSQRELALISVKGDSMEPTLSDGDLVLIHTGARRSEDSGVYVIRLADALMVKRVQLHLDGSLTVASDNAKYTPEHVGPKSVGDLAVVGRVVWAGRRV